MYCNTVKNSKLKNTPWTTGCPGLVARMFWPSCGTNDRQLFISCYLMIYWRYLPHQSEIDRMASRNATRQIFVEKWIVKELTIKFWRNAIWNTQTETLTNGLRTHAAYIKNFLKRPHRIQHRQIRRSLKYHCRQFVEKYAKIRDTSIFWHPDVVATFPDLLELTRLPRVFNETYLKNSWLYPEYSYTL